MFNFFKNILYSIIILIFMILFCFVFLNEKLRLSTPSLSELALNLNKFSTAIVFNYSKNIDKQLFLFSNNIGLEKNPITNQSQPKQTNIGASGFFIFDVQSFEGEELFKKIDNFLIDGLDFMNEFSYQKNVPHYITTSDSFNALENNSPILENPFSSPLSALFDEIWNGNTFVFGGATQFHLSYIDSLKLALKPYFNNIIPINKNIFRTMIIENSPLYIQEFLKKHYIHFEIDPEVGTFNDNIHQSKIVFSILNSQEFLNSLCSSKINPWDMCGRFSLDRNKFRTNMKSVLGIVNDNFKITLNFYWTMRGKDIIYSNHKDFVKNMLIPKIQKAQDNVLIDVASSGDDFLLNNQKNSKYTLFSIYFDMIKTQNEWISFAENLRKNSLILSDYFSSPEGAINFQKIEKSINEMTRFSQKSSIAFRTDGEFLIPELRLFSPSQDLFIHNGQELSPEFINSLKVFVTKAVSFGDYLLPKGLIPIPGPNLTKNGRWVILKSEISIKNIAPYLQSIDPYINIYDSPNQF